MNTLDLKRFAHFSDRVRNSTLKRLRSVPLGKENFKINARSMTISDIASHLIICDEAYLSLLDTRQLEKNLGKSNSISIKTREEFDRLIKRLEDLKIQRHDFILALNDEKINTKITVDSISGKSEEDLGSLIYRMLDHETHHRGTLATYLNVLNSQ
jgi:uncharacterized damage-inducible protein DinB